MSSTQIYWIRNSWDGSRKPCFNKLNRWFFYHHIIAFNDFSSTFDALCRNWLCVKQYEQPTDPRLGMFIRISISIPHWGPGTGLLTIWWQFWAHKTGCSPILISWSFFLEGLKLHAHCWSRICLSQCVLLM